MTVPSFTGVWQPGTSFGCIATVPSGFLSPTSTRHIRQLATTDSAGMPAVVRNLEPDLLRRLNAVELLGGVELDRSDC